MRAGEGIYSSRSHLQNAQNTGTQHPASQSFLSSSIEVGQETEVNGVNYSSIYFVGCFRLV
jgi:hypothetical protein